MGRIVGANGTPVNAPAVQIPALDQDLMQRFQASDGDEMVPILLVQTLRDVRRIAIEQHKASEALARISSNFEQKTGAAGDSP